jgi:hypothetical protein
MAFETVNLSKVPKQVKPIVQEQVVLSWIQVFASIMTSQYFLCCMQLQEH